MAKPEVLKYGQLFPAKDETEQIDIYSASLPTKEYIEIAQITCKDTEDDWNLKQILIKAREIGADGIIILGTAGNAGYGVPIGDLMYIASEEIGIKTTAIKYKENIDK